MNRASMPSKENNDGSTEPDTARQSFWYRRSRSRSRVLQCLHLAYASGTPSPCQAIYSGKDSSSEKRSALGETAQIHVGCLRPTAELIFPPCIAIGWDKGLSPPECSSPRGIAPNMPQPLASRTRTAPSGVGKGASPPRRRLRRRTATGAPFPRTRRPLQHRPRTLDPRPSRQSETPPQTLVETCAPRLMLRGPCAR